MMLVKRPLFRLMFPGDSGIWYGIDLRNSFCWNFLKLPRLDIQGQRRTFPDHARIKGYGFGVQLQELLHYEGFRNL